MKHEAWLYGAAALGIATLAAAAAAQPAHKATAASWYERAKQSGQLSTVDCGPGTSQPECKVKIEGTPPASGSTACTIKVKPSDLQIHGLDQQKTVTWNVTVTSGQMRLAPPASQFVINGNNPALDFTNPQLQDGDIKFVVTDLHKRAKTFTYNFQVQYKDAGGNWVNCGSVDPRVINMG